MRPLTVRTESGSGPLFWRRLPVCGWAGGGESRLRGVEAELDGGLVGVVSEAGEEVADLLLALGDDVSRLSLVDGVGDLPAEALERVAEDGGEVGGGDLRLGVHLAPKGR